MKHKYVRMILLALTMLAIAVPAWKVAADQGFYMTDTSAKPGMLVAVSPADPNVAELATLERAEAMIGVLGAQPTSFDVQDGQQSVVTGGVVNTFVSTANGDIQKGNYITISSLRGFGGKLSGSGWVIGIAQADFNRSSPGAVKSTVSGVSGDQQEIYVGSIPALIKVLYYDDTLALEERDISFLPDNLQRVVDSIAGRRASQIAVVLASILLLAGLFVGAVITNSSVRNGIKSTARQPLAKNAILLRMTQANLIGLGIIIASIVGAFIVLRVF